MKKLQEEIEGLRQDNAMHLIEIQELLIHIMNLEEQVADLDKIVMGLLDELNSRK